MTFHCVRLALLVTLAACPAAVFAGDQPRQQAKVFDKTIQRKVKMNYLLHLPEGYEKSEKRWPLILFLHGAGETGTDVEKVKKHGPPKVVATEKDFPFIVLSPQSPQLGWDVEAVYALLEETISKYRVDEDRVYLTGLSMGGYGTWQLAAAHPERFAAVVPICGGGVTFWARRLRHMPTWAFHGARDTVVPLLESQRMVDAVNKVGGNAKLTAYPDAGHDAWTETYDDPKLYEWLLQQKRNSSRWKGTWKGGDHGGELLCTAVPLGGPYWTATFSGYCDRQFVYQVTMKGKADGKQIRFEGAADLGERDGGIYRWTGAIVGDAFTGEYTSAGGKKGEFRMERVRQ